MDLRKIFSLKERRRQLEIRLQEQRQQIVRVERALSLVDRLEAEIDDKIARLQAFLGLDAIPDVRRPDYANPEDQFDGRRALAKERATVRALERLKQDIPAIRAHWEQQRDQLTAGV